MLPGNDVPGSKLSFWAAELTPEYTRPFQIIWCFDNDLDVSKLLSISLHAP